MEWNGFSIVVKRLFGAREFVFIMLDVVAIIKAGEEIE
jgi:hypothetical protein